MGLSFLTLTKLSPEAMYAGLKDFVGDAVEEGSAFGDLSLRLQRYFGGEGIAFPDMLDFTRATAFQKDVWNATRTIPYGEVRSYTWVAKQIGRPRACRAVGSALGRNRLLIIVPCHRVVAGDGGLGGFGGGLELKKRLLDLEAACVNVRGKTSTSFP